MNNKVTLTLDSITCPHCSKSQQSVILEHNDERNKMSLTDSKNIFSTNCWCCDKSFDVIIENKVTISTKKSDIKIVKSDLINTYEVKTVEIKEENIINKKVKTKKK